MFFGIGCQEMTLEEIGDKFQLTRERVRQIKEKAIRRLRQDSRSKLLKSYLGDLFGFATKCGKYPKSGLLAISLKKRLSFRNKIYLCCDFA